MKEIIDRLKTLNKLDVQLQTIKKDMDRLPKELNEKQAVPRNLKGTIDRAKAEINRLKLEAEAIELEIKAGEEALKRYSSQMNVLAHPAKSSETVKRQMDRPARLEQRERGQGARVARTGGRQAEGHREEYGGAGRSRARAR